MGQSNQAQNHNQQSSSFCCLSRRYIVQKNLQKQNKLRQKNQKSASANINQLQIYSKQRFRDQTHIKTYQNKQFTPNTEQHFTQDNKTKQKHLKFEEVVNLGLESHLLDQKKTSGINKQLNEIKKQIPQLSDVFEQSEKIETRQTSLSSRNLSNKNQLSTNNQKLKNKIQNLKHKYRSKQQQVSSDQPQSSAKPKLHQNNQINLVQQSKHKNLTNNLFESKKNEDSEEIQFFSQNSDSQQQSSSNGVSNQNNFVNQDMLNSKKIELMIHQFKMKENINKNKHRIPTLERIPEESQKIHSSKSEDELSNHIQRPHYQRSEKNERIKQQTHASQNDKRQNQAHTIKSPRKIDQNKNNIHLNQQNRKSKRSHQAQQKLKTQQKERSIEVFEKDKKQTVQKVKCRSQKKISDKLQRPSKKIIAF